MIEESSFQNGSDTDQVQSNGGRLKFIWFNLAYSIPVKGSFFNFFQRQKPQKCTANTNSTLTVNSQLTTSTAISLSPESSQCPSFNLPVKEDDVVSSAICPENKKRVILQCQSGYIESGRLTALMGPSGAGKTTLLNCVTSRITDHVTGQVVVRFHPDVGVAKGRKVRLGFIPQVDSLFHEFTVRETLIFALKINNSSESENSQKLEDILKALDLTNEANSRLGKLSHGQMKRTSIAVEMISSPEILFLDEPTSGLDSDNSNIVVSLLSNLCSKLGLAICCTIHQPSFQLFCQFDMVYMLNRHGSCIYFDSPNKLVSTLVSFGFDEPKHVNPADYATEVANGRFGSTSFDRMAQHAKRSELKIVPSDIKMAQLKPRIEAPFFKQVLLLLLRHLKAKVFRSPSAFGLLFFCILAVLLFGFLNSQPTGSLDGCWSTLNSAQDNEEYLATLEKIHANVSLMVIINICFMFLFAFLALVSMSSDMVTVRKETDNSWYGHGAFFIARSIGDFLILLCTSFPSVFLFYYITDQIWDLTRVSRFILTSILFYAVWEAKGVLAGTIFYKNFMLSFLLVLSAQLPSVAMSGFFIKEFNVFWPLKPLSYISDGQYLMKGLILAIYGDKRCKPNPVDDAGAFFALKHSDPLHTMIKLWPSFNLTASEMKRISIILGLSENYLNPVYEKLNTFSQFSQDISKLGEQESNPEDLSYVLSYWKLQDTGFGHNILLLIILYFVCRTAIYFALIFKKTSRS